ncbi:hypothetical protein [Mesorhizobium sp. KR9-304]|uniref:DUF7220 family protein n=1 Tax=Mesorhizobium sp. KR9-304 TaxID=3156614 RepID=UPI0032B576AA
MTSSLAQSRTASLAEAIINAVAGFLVALATQQIIFPVFGITTTLVQDGAIAALFTGASLVRSYALRRLFLHVEACRLREQALRQTRLRSRFATTGKPSRESTP